MSIRSQREFLKAQIVETDRLLESVRDHPLMPIGLRQRKEGLEEKLKSLPASSREPRTVLFFTGEPVIGSFGIDAHFAGRVLAPFQSMVMSDYAHRWHGTLGRRGRRSGEHASRLLLSGLPRGSFGLELSRADTDEFLEEDRDRLAETLAHVTRLVESAGRSDEDFAIALEETPARVIRNLGDFLRVVADGQAGLRMESGDFRCTLDPAEARDAYERVSDTATKDEDVEEHGVFKGALLESRRFDFLNDAGRKISGRLDDGLTPEQAGEMAGAYFDKPCIAFLRKTIVSVKNGCERTHYSLKGLRKARADSP